MYLFLLVLFFFYNPFFFFLYFIFFSFISINIYCWGGLFFFFDSFVFSLLILMSLFILGVVIMSEKNFNLIILSEILVVMCVFFFIPVNIIMLYVFFEFSMFPILVMILGYGSQIEKISSSYYLIFYASLCSFPFLFVYFSSDLSFMLVYFDFFLSWEVVLILSLSFMMKFPVYFLHLWLPKAHVEAPTTASMLLAGLLLKLGTAGFMRILGSLNFIHLNFWFILAFLGMILASFCCIFQSDSKSLAAYSSVTHMSFLLLSFLFMFMSSKTSSLMLMLSHGYTSTIMFYLIGEFYHSSGSRMIYYMNSFFNSSIFMVVVFSFVFLSNSGVPPSLSFVSEFITISSGISFFYFSFILVFIYFVFSFYYSIYLITNCLMGKNLIFFNTWGLGFSIPLVFMMYNIFWITLFI
uniref:NADH-ubiquinone oxidoreductase chain 4 n=1 Tax=Steinernema carpocapsae TaxID=34508 RepID=A0A3G4R4J0_STECR|nr:NADH dehydrogenase subunit 4 [Steinernema carpocapsae]